MAGLRARGWTLNRIAALTGVTPKTLYRWLTGRKRPFANGERSKARLAAVRFRLENAP